MILAISVEGDERMKKTYFIILVLVSALIWEIFAEETLSEEEIMGKLESISHIGDDSERLEAYDRFAGGLGVTRNGKRASEESGSESKWEVSVQTDPIDDSKKIFFMLPAENSTAYDKVGLFIRYQNGTSELFVAWDDYLADNTEVTLRFGENDPYTEHWSKSADSTAVFCKNTVSFIHKILEYDRLVMRITPYNEGPKTAVFDIRGLKEEISPYSDVLGWF